MKVLILGASGFIGLPAAIAFARAGHIVYGQTRSSSTAKKLAADEILPVVCDPHTDDGKAIWGKIAAQADVVIDILNSSGPANGLATFKHFVDIVSKRPRAAPKATYIYTGGLWSLSRGAGGLETWADERQPRSDYNEAVGWRAEIEDPILLSEPVNGIVIRGPILYGKSGSFVASYIFDAALEASKKKDGVFETFARDDTRWQTIHTDDMADLYVRVAERGTTCKGQVFLPSNSQSERLRDVLDAIVRVSGCKGYTMKEPEDPYDKAWVSTLNAHPSLGAALAGWYPRKLSLVDGMDIYWASYLANKGEVEARICI